ncbi:hypothetical protein CERZMDRAFT_94946 [Cercospora zeae-maydis SCOH1-5]|uniref:Uncharacterized protein n=1 Tax=Cercospora zeae-maydis SCOH1-5 TaxID=717836 RepID=A0A6A6FPZ3_9PEZI|nr:hypothetical protein CERZMDRAFT_94946 [Cercospora zeae-maydis SCOH1-5]
MAALAIIFKALLLATIAGAGASQYPSGRKKRPSAFIPMLVREEEMFADQTPVVSFGVLLLVPQSLEDGHEIDHYMQNCNRLLYHVHPDHYQTSHNYSYNQHHWLCLANQNSRRAAR